MPKYVLPIFLYIALQFPHTVYAWIFPEHRDIAVLAIQKLSPEKRTALDSLWKTARRGYESRLTISVADTSLSINPAQLDYASWPAIAGDHSTSSYDMLNTILNSDWILKVADIAAELKEELKNSKSRSKKINAIRDSDISLQRADEEYASRAGTNNVHFLLARPWADISLDDYIDSCNKTGTELNAVGAYSWFHTSAINKANRYAHENLTEQEKSSLMLAALADEAFALHFLEDVFAAGHISGTWGKAALRKGTHDFYNENGLDVTTWNNKRLILMGDAYMRDEDADFTSNIIRLSLEEFISAASVKNETNSNPDSLSLTNTADTFSISINNFMHFRKFDNEKLKEVLRNTPVPALSDGLGQLPRFRSELGLFIGVSGGVNSSTVHGGFGPSQHTTGFIGGIEENIRIGFGIEGVLNEAGDGLAFIQFGWRQDGTSTNQLDDFETSTNAGNITSAIPSRSAYNLRFRVPFCLIPGDLIFAAPILLIFSPKTFEKMAIAAGNGGLIPWQSGIATPIGRFQFVAGREVGISLYGRQRTNDVIFVPNSSSTFYYLIDYKSTKFDFPVIEYRPFRIFSKDQSSSLLMQFSVGLDIPHTNDVIIADENPVPELKSVWSFDFRIIFNWRHYFK